MTVQTYMPSMRHRDFERFGFYFWNQHKKQFGVKIEVAAAMQRTPVPIALSVLPAGLHDLTIARRPRGVLAHMRPSERALGDPGYLGDPLRIYAPPRRNMHSYVPGLDKTELTLQRRVEMVNRRLREFRCLGSRFRKGAVHAFKDLEVIAIVVGKLLFLDISLNQDHLGHVHVDGPRRAHPVRHSPRNILTANVVRRVRRR